MQCAHSTNTPIKAVLRAIFSCDMAFYLSKKTTMKYTITPKCIEGDACFVKNYRRKTKVWERGTVLQIDARLRSDGTFRLSYWVRLDRMTQKAWGWPKRYEDKHLFLTVGDDAIEKAKQ